MWFKLKSSLINLSLGSSFNIEQNCIIPSLSIALSLKINFFKVVLYSLVIFWAKEIMPSLSILLPEAFKQINDLLNLRHSPRSEIPSFPK